MGSEAPESFRNLPSGPLTLQIRIEEVSFHAYMFGQQEVGTTYRNIFFGVVRWDECLFANFAERNHRKTLRSWGVCVHVLVPDWANAFFCRSSFQNKFIDMMIREKSKEIASLHDHAASIAARSARCVRRHKLLCSAASDDEKCKRQIHTTHAHTSKNHQECCRIHCANKTASIHTRKKSTIQEYLNLLEELDPKKCLRVASTT